MISAEEKDGIGAEITIDGDFETVVREWGTLTNKILVDVWLIKGVRLSVNDLTLEAIKSMEKKGYNPTYVAT